MINRLVWPVVFVAAIIFAGYALLVLGGDNFSKTDTTASPEVLVPYIATEVIPDKSVTDMDGKTLALKDLPSGTIITFWSSSCSECQTQLKDFVVFAKSNPSFSPLLVNNQEPADTIKAALEAWQVPFTSYLDASGQATQAFAATMPATYYIKEGKIRYFFPGRIGTQHLEALVSPSLR